MNNKINDGGPAFPTHHNQSLEARISGGMTLRDWFAGQALGAVLVNFSPRDKNVPTVTFATAFAYEIADAMLRARTGHEQP